MQPGWATAKLTVGGLPLSAPLALDDFFKAASLKELYAVLKAYTGNKTPFFLERHHEGFLKSLQDVERVAFNALPRAEFTVLRCVLQEPVHDQRYLAIIKEPCSVPKSKEYRYL